MQNHAKPIKESDCTRFFFEMWVPKLCDNPRFHWGLLHDASVADGHVHAQKKSVKGTNHVANHVLFPLAQGFAARIRRVGRP